MSRCHGDFYALCLTCSTGCCTLQHHFDYRSAQPATRHKDKGKSARSHTQGRWSTHTPSARVLTDLSDAPKRAWLLRRRTPHGDLPARRMDDAESARTLCSPVLRASVRHGARRLLAYATGHVTLVMCACACFLLSAGVPCIRLGPRFGAGTDSQDHRSPSACSIPLSVCIEECFTFMFVVDAVASIPCLVSEDRRPGRRAKHTAQHVDPLCQVHT